MLSISGGMDAVSAGAYFAKEDYYLQGGEAASQWLGQGAENFGLNGSVDKTSFSAVSHGQDPRTGEQLVAPKITKDKGTGEQIHTHRAGNDLTFSAPKSISIAYAAGVEGILLRCVEMINLFLDKHLHISEDNFP